MVAMEFIHYCVRVFEIFNEIHYLIDCWIARKLMQSFSSRFQLHQLIYIVLIYSPFSYQIFSQLYGWNVPSTNSCVSIFPLTRQVSEQTTYCNVVEKWSDTTDTCWSKWIDLWGRKIYQLPGSKCVCLSLVPYEEFQILFVLRASCMEK